MLCTAGFDGYFKRVNAAFERTLGYTPEEMMARPFLEFVHPDDQEATIGEMGELSAGITTLNFQNRYRRKDGSYCWLEWTAQPVVEQALIYAVARDISQRKETEEQLRQFAADLERSNQELEQFAYVASHDMQEPLRKIQAFGDRLKSRAGDHLDEQSRDYLERMQNAASRMQTLMQDLLAYSRVTSRAAPFAPVDLNVVVRDVLDDIETQIERTKGRVEVGDLPTLDADAGQMRQLFQNLISNALKFHHERVAPLVKVDSARDGVACTITICDNGIGFDDRYAERIFGVFERLHGRGEYDGTGIGLAICRKIVEHHGGTIAARSTPGEGATFTMILPLQNLDGKESQ
jgi:PAS domain S-box-containing protein